MNIQVSPHEVVDFIIAIFALLRAGEEGELARGHMLVYRTNGPLPLTPPLNIITLYGQVLNVSFALEMKWFKISGTHVNVWGYVC